MSKLDLIPKIGSSEAKLLYGETEWRCFARKAQKNPFMKEYLFKKYEGTCQWCDRKLFNFVLHHIDYDHECKHTELVKFPNPTEKRPNRTITVPDCEKCFNEDYADFKDCSDRLVPVH